MRTKDEIARFLDSYPPPVRDIGLQLRRTIRSAIPKAHEMLDRPAKIVGYGFGPRYADTICTIIPGKRGVKLGIR